MEEGTTAELEAKIADLAEISGPDFRALAYDVGGHQWRPSVDEVELVWDHDETRGRSVRVRGVRPGPAARAEEVTGDA
jgi:hypothetical protein